MNILLTGATGYIGRRLLPVLVEEGHHVVCLLRDKRRFDWEDFSEEFLENVSVIEADLNKSDSLDGVTTEVDVAFYLVHSMSSSDPDFRALEAKSAEHFAHYLDQTSCKHLIYLSGIVNDANLSPHLLSRKNVEDILTKAKAPLTVLRAAIIIGSGSASFEIIRDLVEKLPIMVAPRWLNTRCQPIGIRNVVEYLSGVMMKPETYDQTFDIGGTEILTYKQMLMGFAKVRGLKRVIITIPVLTPKLSSLWLLLVTSTTFSLARSLVSSMKNEVVCRDNRILDIVPIELYDYTGALQLAFDKISQKHVVSTWKDSIARYGIGDYFNENMQVPEHGVFTDRRQLKFTRKKEEVITNIWSIGGKRGWYFGDWMWNIRGYLDTLVGGVGIRRGRRSDTELRVGDALDFWRVLVADKVNGRLLLYAEMKLPGEAWLEFKIKNDESNTVLLQTATFRPLGLWGRLYWYSVLPFHALIFPKMIDKIVSG